MAVTGIDWDFSPTLAVVRDDRWGRTYEGFSEDPRSCAPTPGRWSKACRASRHARISSARGHVIATAKHFVGDGGTAAAATRATIRPPRRQLRDIHGAGYPPAIDAGVQTSWRASRWSAAQRCTATATC